MSYSDFTLRDVLKNFDLKLVEKSNLFPEISPLIPSDFLTEILAENIPLALGSNTEKSRSELIIVPILIELRRQFKQKICFFSGISLNVKPEKGLNGNCDFLITASEELLLIKAPIVAIVEAKKEDLTAGISQCIAEMIAVQIFNQQEENSILQILGVITSGTNWRFLTLENKTLKIDLTEYYLNDISKILGILAAAIKINISL